MSKTKKTIPEEDSPLIFSWLRKDRRALKLSVFIAGSAIVHAGAFYLFQVVYATTDRVDAAPSGITILDTDQPEVRRMIREIEDRLVFQRAPSETSGTRVSLSDYGVTFEPSFQNREPSFRTPPSPESIGRITPLVILPPEKVEPIAEEEAE